MKKGSTMSMLQRVNRNVDFIFKTEDEVIVALDALYTRLQSLRKLGKIFEVDAATIHSWLVICGIERRGLGGANNTKPGARVRINQADPNIFKNLTAWQIGKKYGVSARYIHYLKATKRISITYRNADRGELQEQEDNY